MDDVLRDLSDDSAKAKLAKFLTNKQRAYFEKFDAKELVALLLQGRKDPDN